MDGLHTDGRPQLTQFPAQSNGMFVKVQDFRYGENSHQQAALYRDLYPAPGSIVSGSQLCNAHPDAVSITASTAPACGTLFSGNPLLGDRPLLLRRDETAPSPRLRSWQPHAAPCTYPTAQLQTTRTSANQSCFHE